MNRFGRAPVPEEAKRFNKKLGAQVRRRRKALGYTIGRFARTIGVSETALIHWELGTNQLTAYYAMRLLSALSRAETRRAAPVTAPAAAARPPAPR